MCVGHFVHVDPSVQGPSAYDPLYRVLVPPPLPGSGHFKTCSSWTSLYRDPPPSRTNSNFITRMHSSRMHTARTLTRRGGQLNCSFPVSGRGFCSRGQCLLLGGVCSRGLGCLLWGGSLLPGVSAPRGCLLGVSAPGGVSALGGVCSGGWVYHVTYPMMHLILPVCCLLTN